MKKLLISMIIVIVVLIGVFMYGKYKHLDTTDINRVNWFEEFAIEYCKEWDSYILDVTDLSNIENMKKGISEQPDYDVIELTIFDDDDSMHADIYSKTEALIIIRHYEKLEVRKETTNLITSLFL